MSVEKRIKSLEKREQTVTIFSKVVKEFIADNAEIKPYILLPGIYLDNISLYEEAIENIGNEDNTLKIVRNIIYYMADKFGIYGDNTKRINILSSGEVDEYDIIKPVSITKFVGENAALCLERAAFFHNCLKILGLDDILKIGSLRFSNIEENHAYNLIITKMGNYLLVDPNNFVVINKDGKRMNSECVFKLTKDEYYGLLEGNISYNADKTKHPVKSYVEDFNWQYT